MCCWVIVGSNFCVVHVVCVYACVVCVSCGLFVVFVSICGWAVCEVEGVCVVCACGCLLCECGVCEVGLFVCVGVWVGFVCGVRVRVWCVCCVCDVCVCCLCVV